MIQRLLAAASLAAVLGTTTGCAVNRTSATLLPDADLSKVKTVYVVHSPTDKYGVDEALKTAFRNHGFTVVGGPAQTPPYPADATVTYIDKWMWDITMYLLELKVTMRNPVNDFPLATADSLHTSLTRKSTAEMSDEAVTNLLAAKH